jgi:hypothetical protein
VKLLNDPQHEISTWFTSIAKQNTVARRLLEANLKGMPEYKYQGELVSYALPSDCGKQNTLLQPARVEDIPALVDFYNRQASAYQYSPVLTESWLRSLNGSNGLSLGDFLLLKQADQIHASVALWDQRNIKQTIVRAYRFPLNLLRPAYNLCTRFLHRIPLPAIGEQVDYIFLAFLAIDIEKHVDDLLQGILYAVKKRDARIAMLGLSPQNPLTNMLSSYPKQEYHTLIESVCWPELNAANQSKQLLESLPVQPEIALL